MSDTEWIELRGLWQEKKSQLPVDLQRHARRQARSLWISNAIFWPIVVSECAFAVWKLVYQRGWLGKADAGAILGFVLPMSVWFLVSQRRQWPDPLETPREMLARFERDLRRGRLAGWLGAGGFLVLTLFVLGEATLLRGSLGRVWALDRRLFAMALVGLALVILVPKWAGWSFRRGQARIDRWRQEL